MVLKKKYNLRKLYKKNLGALNDITLINQIPAGISTRNDYAKIKSVYRNIEIKRQRLRILSTKVPSSGTECLNKHGNSFLLKSSFIRGIIIEKIRVRAVNLSFE